MRQLCLTAAFCFLPMAVFVGCGTAEYERRYDKTLEELWQQEPFLQLREESVTIPLTKADAKNPVNAELRLPKQFDNTAKSYPPDEASDDPVDRERMYVPFAQSLPNYRFSYEQFIGPPGTVQEAFYIYVYAGQGRRSLFAAPLESAIRKAYKGIKSSDLEDLWEEVKCPTPDGSKLEWNRLSLRLPEQTFATKSSQDFTKKDVDGILEVFSISNDENHLMFILRMPTSLEKEIDPEAIAKACAGTLRWSDGEDEEEEE